MDNSSSNDSDLRDIANTVIRLSVKLDALLDRLERLDQALTRDYVRKESIRQCLNDLERLDKNATWLTRTVIAAIIGIAVTAIQVNLFKP